MKQAIWAVALMALMAAPALADVKLDGQIRLRAEVRDAGDDVSTGDSLISRIRLGASGDLNERVLFKVSFQDFRNLGEGGHGGAINDLQGVDLKEGYLDVKEIFELGSANAELRLGRWAMKYGDQRLVSSLDWHGVGRSWDGARLRFAKEGYFTDIFTTVINNRTGDSYDEKSTFSGIYESWNYSDTNTAEGYLFWNRNGKDDNLYTIGLHAKGKVGGLGYNLEGAYQMGERTIVNDDGAGNITSNDMDIAAYGLVVGVDYSFGEKSNLKLEATHASGDDDGGDDTLATFNPLFPFGHAYQGFLDRFAWKNGTDIMARYTLKMWDAKWMIDFHHFMLATEKDAWYAGNGAPIPYLDTDPTKRSDSTAVGQELDIHMKCKVAGAIGIWAGYSHFFPGARADNTGLKDGMDWFFIQGTATF